MWYLTVNVTIRGWVPTRNNALFPFPRSANKVKHGVEFRDLRHNVEVEMGCFNTRFLPPTLLYGEKREAVNNSSLTCGRNWRKKCLNTDFSPILIFNYNIINIGAVVYV